MSKHALKALIVIELNSIEYSLENIAKWNNLIQDCEVKEIVRNSKLVKMHEYINKLKNKIHNEKM